MGADNKEAALDRVFELAARLGDGMDSYLADRGLNPARARVLMALHQRGALVQRQLSQALDCSPRHVTGLVDTLESAGLVRREAHPTDRRAILVTLTKHGARAAAHMADQRRSSAQAMFRDTPAGDITTFIAVADQALTAIRQAETISGSGNPAGHSAR